MVRLQEILALVTRGLDDPDATRAFGRVGAVLFIACGVVVIASQPFIEGSDQVMLGGAPTLTLAAAGAIVVGLGGLALPWGHWQRSFLMIQPVVAGVLIAVPTRIVPAALDHYLALYMIPFIYVGITQRFRMVCLVSAVVVVSFLVGGLGSLPPDTYLNFCITASVGVIVSTTLVTVTEHYRRAHRQLEHLLSATRRLGRCDNIDAALTVFETTLCRATGADAVVTFLATPPGSTRFVAAGGGWPHHGTVAEIDLLDVGDLGDRGGLAALGRGEQWFVSDMAGDDLAARLGFSAALRSCLFAPLWGEGGRLGAVVVGWRRRRATIAPSVGDTVGVLTTEAGVVLERLRHAEKVRLEADTDPLTGLLNRRAIDRRFLELVGDDTVVLIDLDEFKSVNDRQGHHAGDRILRTLSRCLQQACRSDDWCGRLGGDEFVMVLRGGGAEAARSVTRVVQEVWATTVPETTLSIGAAVHRPHDSPRQTLAVADGALYRAKSAGRDRIELAGGEPLVHEA
jgi:diguanylate cyclase (GGDEF)-like protein